MKTLMFILMLSFLVFARGGGSFGGGGHSFSSGGSHSSFSSSRSSFSSSPSKSFGATRSYTPSVKTNGTGTGRSWSSWRPWNRSASSYTRPVVIVNNYRTYPVYYQSHYPYYWMFFRPLYIDYNNHTVSEERHFTVMGWVSIIVSLSILTLIVVYAYRKWKREEY